MQFSILIKNILKWYHGPIIQAGIASKKISCFMRDSACSWLIVEKAKIFRIYAKHFLFSPRERNLEP